MKGIKLGKYLKLKRIHVMLMILSMSLLILAYCMYEMNVFEGVGKYVTFRNNKDDNKCSGKYEPLTKEECKKYADENNKRMYSGYVRYDYPRGCSDNGWFMGVAYNTYPYKRKESKTPGNTLCKLKVTSNVDNEMLNTINDRSQKNETRSKTNEHKLLSQSIYNRVTSGSVKLNKDSIKNNNDSIKNNKDELDTIKDDLSEIPNNYVNKTTFTTKGAELETTMDSKINSNNANIRQEMTGIKREIINTVENKIDDPLTKLAEFLNTLEKSKTS